MGVVVNRPSPANRGGGRVERYEVSQVRTAGHLLRVQAPDGVVEQIRLADRTYRLDGAEPSGWRTLRGTGPEPTPAVLGLLELLRDVLTLRCPDMVAFALALDWTKIPEDGVAASRWARTEVYDLIHGGKYRFRRPEDVARLRQVGNALVDRLCAVMDRHPVLGRADAVVAVPGHDSEVLSFGSRLAAATARRRDLPLVRCTSTVPFRTAAKNLDGAVRAANIDGTFRCNDDITGQRIVIVDDLYSTGSTVSETARALRQAGARGVAVLCGVRTLRWHQR